MVCCVARDLAAVLRLGRLYTDRRFGCVNNGRPMLWGGRIHVEPRAYRRLGLAGLVERTLFTRAPTGLCAGWAAGKAIDARQCYEARRKGILVPRADDFQPVMSLLELNDRDRGA